MKRYGNWAGSIFLVSILLLTIYQVVEAGCCASTTLAGSQVNAVKSNITLSSLIWRAQIESISGTFGDGPKLDQIGWTWWHVYERCNGKDVQYTVRSPVTDYNKAYQSRVYDQAFEVCSGTKQTGNKGNHYFLKSGVTVNLAPDYLKNFP